MQDFGLVVSPGKPPTNTAGYASGKANIAEQVLRNLANPIRPRFDPVLSSWAVSTAHLLILQDFQRSLETPHFAKLRKVGRLKNYQLRLRCK